MFHATGISYIHMLIRGEQRKRPELPFKKIPVLVDGDVTLAESTAILRYVGQLPGGEAWYGARSLQVITISIRKLVSDVR